MDANFGRYSCLDSACTLEAYHGFWNELSGGYQPAYDSTVALFEPLMFMATRGIRVDHAMLQETKTEITEATAKRQEELNSLVGRELNVNSPQQMQSFFYVEKGWPPYMNRVTGAVTVDDSALTKMARGISKRPGLREAKLVQEIRGLGKLSGTYLNIEFDSDGRVRCSWNPRGTKFGRLSSSKTVFGTGTNLQNLPQAFKKFLVPDPGYFFVEFDKRQAEWIAVAYLTGDANMLKVVESGIDSHTYTASLMFGLPEDLIKQEHKIVGNEVDREEILRRRGMAGWSADIISQMPESMSCRQMGKKSNHGLNYDEGWYTFMESNELSAAESKRVIAMYHQIYPGIRLWYESIKRELQKDRTLTNCFGRKCRFMDAWGDDLFKAAYAFKPQSTVVDGLNKGLCDIYHSEICAATFDSGADVLAQVHDSILMQFPMDWLDDGRFHLFAGKCIDLTSTPMEYNTRTFTIPTDMKMGLNWGGHHKESNPTGMREVNWNSDPAKFTASVREALGVSRTQ